jgi:DNA processing protein
MEGDVTARRTRVRVAETARPPRQRTLVPAEGGIPSVPPEDPPHGESAGVGWVRPEELLGALNEIEQRFAPKRIYAAGPMRRPLPHPRVALIGARSASEAGRNLARELAEFLARQGVTIVSGLARGIDTEAHAAALRVGGATIAVLGTPLSRTYPRENSSLQAEIMRHHLAISQFGEGEPTLPRNFVLRNRTMALIADASVIVESGEGGGSLHQGWEALRLGRPLFIHRREFAKPELEWPKEMASYGAVQFGEPADILEYVPSASRGLADTAVEPA